MKVFTFIALSGLLGISACGETSSEPEAPATPSFDIDSSRVTVSGVSAGAYMAGQFHIAHSSLVSGAGLIAGGPYWCSTGSMSQGLGPCMNGGDVGVSGLLQYAYGQADVSNIDTLNNLQDDHIWVFHGADDAIIHPDVPAAAVEFYASLMPPGAITSVTDIKAPHGVPTIVGGVACSEVATPFLNACDYDAAGELLAAIAGIAGERAEPAGELRTITQPGADDAEMLDEALLYVSPACASGETCGLHIAFHGCQQSTEFVADAFAKNAGYNHWADNNRLLILYPQVASSKIAPLNPLGCWDWWGYTDANYATQLGIQNAVVMQLIEALSGQAL